MVAGAAVTATTSRNEELLGRRIALVSVSIGAAIAVSKILVGAYAGSAAIVYTGLLIASKPPDAEHPYGHGRYETLSSLAVGAILLLAGAGILWHGLTQQASSSSLPHYVLYPLVASVFLKVALSALKFRIGRRIASLSLQSDAWHDLTDLMSTSIALIAVLLTMMDPLRFGASDRIGAILIGMIIILLSIRLVGRTVDQLVDTMPEPAKLAEIRRSALGVPGTLGIEKCFARRTGLRYHVDLHLEVDPEMTVSKSHRIATDVRFAIKRDLPWVADVLVHVEPSPARASDAAPDSVLERTHGK
jgi:cation diffusion facilitator family transporter